MCSSRFKTLIRPVKGLSVLFAALLIINAFVKNPPLICNGLLNWANIELVKITQQSTAEQQIFFYTLPLLQPNLVGSQPLLAQLRHFNQQCPGNERGLWSLALSQVLVGDSISAITSLEALNQANPGNKDEALFLATLLLAKGNISEASTIIRTASIQDLMLQALTEVAKRAKWDKLITDAIDDYNLLLELFPERADGYLGLAGIYWETGKRTAAAELYREAVSHQSIHNESWHDAMGRIALVEEDWAKAALHFQQVAQIRSDDSWSWVNLGQSLQKAGQQKAAVQALKQAIALDATNLHSHLAIGLAYTALHQWEEAKQALQKVVEIDPQRAEAFYMLGEVYIEIGDEEEAMAAYQQAVALQPNNQTYHQALQDMLSQNAH